MLHQENPIFRSAFCGKMQQYEMAIFILFTEREETGTPDL